MKQKPLLTVLYLLGVISQVQGGEIKVGSLKFDQVVRYALASTLYWDPGANYWDKDGWNKGAYQLTMKLHRSIGKEVRARVWIKEAEGGNKWVYIAIPGFKVGECTFTLEFSSDGTSMVFVDAGMKSLDFVKSAALVSESYIIRVPDNWHSMAKEFDGTFLEHEEDLRVGLKKFLSIAEKRKDGEQHFFVGPFSKLDSKIVVLWLEERKMLTITIPSGFNFRDILIEGTAFDDFNSYGLGQKMDGREEERIRLFYRDRRISNCVYDGALIEVGR